MSNPNLVRKPATSVVVGESSFNQIAAAIGGGSGGSGGKNYIQNPNFNGNSTANWNMRKVTLSSFIPTGNLSTAADAGHTISVSGSSTLEGAYSLLVQGSSLFTAGNCLVSDAFTIDREDLAKVLGWSFSYEAVTSNMDFSGTTSNTWAVYIAEVSAASGAGADTVTSWIQPAGVYNMTQGTGVGLASGTFQTTAAGLYYRLVLVCINSEAAATTLKVDDFQLGPQKVVYGSPVTDWVSYTPTISWTAGVGFGVYGRYRRVGDSLHAQVYIPISGAVTASPLTINVPTGLTIDSTKVAGVFGGNQTIPAGTWSSLRTGVAFYNGVVNISSSTQVILSVNANGNIVTNTVPATWANNDYISCEFFAPVTGWSSTVQMSNDTDTRVVAARYTTSASNSTLNGATTHLDFNIVRYDTHSAGTGGAGSGKNYIIPVSGYYKISGCIALTSSAWTAGANRYIQLHVNGPELILLSFYPITASATNFLIVNGSVTSYFTAGQSIRLEMSNATGNTVTTSGDTASNYFQIERVSGPATIAASESVNAKATAASTSLPSGSTTNIVFSTVEFDTHGSYNNSTGIYTVPVSGKYAISGVVYSTSSGGLTITQEVRLIANQTGSTSRSQVINRFVAASTSAQQVSISGDTVFNCIAGDQIRLTVFNGTGNTITLNGGSNDNLFMIERLGN
jgi:hypothetical protein